MDGLIALTLAKKYTDKVGQDIISAGFKVQVEDNRSILNRQGEEKVLYLLPKEYGSDQDGYDEFVYANSNWEWVGKTDVSLDMDYNELENIPVLISADSPTGYETRTPLKGRLDIADFLYSIINSETNEIELRIKNNAITYEMLKSAFQNELFKDYGVLTNPPSDFYTNYSSAPVRNGIWEILPSSPLDGAPTTKLHRLINYYNESERIQFVITNPQDESFGKEQLFMRVQYMGNMGVWQELTGGGSQIVSGVVNANGTITFTDSEGNSFTTSGSNLVTSGNEQIGMGYDEGGFYFLFDDGQEEVNNGTD